MRLRISSADDARSTVRKYIVGTRSRHGKIASIMMDEDTKGPDEKGVWTIGGTYVTQEGDRKEFTASVTSKGEVVMGSIAPTANTRSLERRRR